MRRIRPIAAALCGVLSVAGIVLGATYTYVSRSLFNPDVFATRVANGLAHPEVARVVAAELTDQIIALRQDLIAYRPFIVGSVERLVGSPPFRMVIRRAVKESHKTLISETGQSIALTVQDAGVLVRNTLSMYPQVASKVPDQAITLLDTPEGRVNGERLARVLKIAHRMRTRAVVLFALGVLFGALGFALSRHKDRYVLRCGLGLTITALSVGLVARFGGIVLAAAMKSEFMVSLVHGLWPTFVQPLAARMLVLASMGLVVVAGVTSTLSRVNLATIGSALSNGISGRPRHAGLGVLRATGFVILGALTAFYPQRMLEVVLVGAGALLFFFGLQEAFAIAQGWLPRIEEAVAHKKRGGAGPRVAMSVALVVVLLGAGAWWLVRRDSKVETPAMVDACNGHPELCDRPLNEVAFATSHNSMSAADIADWLFPNQEKGIRAQLEDGIRGFLIDVHYAVPVGSRIKTILADESAARKKYVSILGTQGVDAAMRIRDRLVGEETDKRDVYLGHGFCELGATKFVTALEEIREFLVMNPGEVIVIVVQDEGVTPQDVAECFVRSGLDRLVYRGPVVKPWPTLREMIATDQRVLVLAENMVSDDVPWYHLVTDVVQETPYGFKTPEEFSNKPNRGGTVGSLLLLNHWIETTPTPLPSNAEIVNAYDFLLARARQARKERGMIPNLVAVDFYRTGDVVRVTDALNGVGKHTVAAKP